MMRLKRSALMRLAAAMAIAAAIAPGVAYADKIKHPIAVFSGLDKITGRIISFEVAIEETVQFGSLQVTPRICYTRPATEAPQTTTFVEVDEIAADNDYKRIFSGWMYAASPGLHGIEHSVYDIWLTDCKGGTEIIPTPSDVADNPEAPPPEIRKDTKSGRRPLVPPGATVTGGPIQVGPPPGLVERRQPSQRYYPTNQAPIAIPGRDPAGNK